MEKNRINDIFFYTYPFLNEKGVQSFTSTRFGGVSINKYASLNIAFHTGDEVVSVIENRKRLSSAILISLSRMVMAQQTHSANVYRVMADDAGKGAFNQHDAIADSDALITNVPNVCITIQTADCVPVLLYDPVQKAIGVVHAGWKGIMSSITVATVEAMHKAYGCNPLDMLAVIGPSISPEVYEVGEALLYAAEQTFGEKAALLCIPRKGKIFFDLWKATEMQLVDIGLLSANIQTTGLCTYSDSDFFSARKEGIQSGRIISGLMLG